MSGTRECLDVNLVTARFIGLVGDPLAVGWELPSQSAAWTEVLEIAGPRDGFDAGTRLFSSSFQFNTTTSRAGSPFWGP